jgi:hypothetical protein
MHRVFRRRMIRMIAIEIRRISTFEVFRREYLQYCGVFQ